MRIAQFRRLQFQLLQKVSQITKMHKRWFWLHQRRRQNQKLKFISHRQFMCRLLVFALKMEVAMATLVQ